MSYPPFPPSYEYLEGFSLAPQCPALLDLVVPGSSGSPIWISYYPTTDTGFPPIINHPPTTTTFDKNRNNEQFVHWRRLDNDFPWTPSPKGGVTFRMVYQGRNAGRWTVSIAACHSNDRWVRKVGVLRARLRALEGCTFSFLSSTGYAYPGTASHARCDIRNFVREGSMRDVETLPVGIKNMVASVARSSVL